MTSHSPERWARFLEEHAPGLTWLAATLLEWAELPPGARRGWSVTAQEARSGEVSALSALEAASGLLAVAAKPGVPPPLLAQPEAVRRLLGAPETVEAVFAANPFLLLRRAPSDRRGVFVFDGDAPPAPAGLRCAPEASATVLERFRGSAVCLAAASGTADLLGPVQRGAVWVLEVDGALAGMFRVEGVGRRRVQVADACVHPALRGQGLGTLLLRGAAHVVRAEYSSGAVLLVPEEPSALDAARAAGYEAQGLLEDVVLA